MKKLGILLLLTFFFSPAYAQYGYEVSKQEVCMDIAASATTIANHRDNGITPREFALAMIGKYDKGIISYQMLDNISNVAVFVYDDWRALTPTQIGVTAYRLCMRTDV